MRRRRRRRACLPRPPTGSRCRWSGCCSCSPSAATLLTVEIRGLQSLGRVPRDRARDGAARAGAGGALRSASTVATAPFFRRPFGPRVRRRRPSARCSRSPAGSWSDGPSATRRDDDTALVRGSSCSSSWRPTSLNFALDRARPPAYDDGFRPWSQARSLFLTVLPSEFATALLTAGVAFTLRAARHRRGRPRRRRAVRLPVHPARERAGRGARRGARAAHARARVAAGRPALARCCRRSRCATR